LSWGGCMARLLLIDVSTAVGLLKARRIGRMSAFDT
jgi:hypothetical protein